MQVLKDDVRESIKSAAVATFMDKGYQKASMREIASQAGLSVGNLYRYFKNKEELFTAIIKPLIDLFEEVQKGGVDEFKGDMMDVNFLEHSEIIDIMVKSRAVYRQELFLIFLRTEGSPFASSKQKFKKFLEIKIREFINYHLEGDQIIKGRLFATYMASSIVDVFCVILEEAEDNETFIYNLMEYSEYIIKPALRNLMAIKNNEIKFRRISNEEIHRRFSYHCGDSGDNGTKDHRSN